MSHRSKSEEVNIIMERLNELNVLVYKLPCANIPEQYIAGWQMACQLAIISVMQGKEKELIKEEVAEGFSDALGIIIRDKVFDIEEFKGLLV